MGDLIVVCGNSGSGKSTVARQLRPRMGRGTALVEQDYLRSIVLREHGEAPDPITPALIALRRHAMRPAAQEFTAGGHEGLASHQRPAGRAGRADHPRDVPLDETIGAIERLG